MGQSLVIGSSMLLYSIYELAMGTGSQQCHHLALYLLLPFLGVSGALFYHNSYPAAVFVGDTYCYFAGMTFAVVGILGCVRGAPGSPEPPRPSPPRHYSKTMALFFMPQFFNFVFSCPQLFHLVPCPRHRMPRRDPATGLLECSVATFAKDEIGGLGRLLLFLALTFRLVRYEEAPGPRPGQTTVTVTNFTVVNLALKLFGPLSEPALCRLLLCVQCAFSGLGFLARYKLAAMIF